MHTYRTTILSIGRAGALDLDIDLGFDLHLAQRVRLAAIATADTATDDPKKAAAWVRAHLKAGGGALTVQTTRDAKGRYLATLTDAPAPHTYNTSITRVIDGDTLDLSIDLGFELRAYERVRLLGINTAEKNTDAGKHAADWVREWVAKHGPAFTVDTERREKYGRYLATIATPYGHDLIRALLNAGLAAPYDGTGPRPLPSSAMETTS
jgi:micrococcal nuclease